ncbi:hypothetical protein [Solitalea canadensis]|uniref:Uncharacterized protein n=1 Tax=Solitalea canadensis (strain ATCC 29591 / DSM 3403 / JCM 21819 / LMG 8368 / NBRC 15130 / NCIMB 12057 / USAM 9D) TaxID=929556 RepID=H8KVZ3_SOLCM|nr:hypothetical protein [Solitalea canadensis]AFD06896.1 hypothetical protein Solca_1835 [Solitalea canadensis DSM 3403]
MKKLVTNDTLTEFTPELLNHFKANGYKSIQEQLIFHSKWASSIPDNDHEDNCTYLLTPSLNDKEGTHGPNKNSWYGNCIKLYSIDSTEVEQMAHGVNGLVYQINYPD